MQVLVKTKNATMRFCGKIVLVILGAVLISAHARAETYTYSCLPCIFPGIARSSSDGCDVVQGRTYPLKVDDARKVLTWRGKQYAITDQPNCAKSGWHAEGQGVAFDFCMATKGYAAIESSGEIKVRCDFKR